jgi:hypothetical protein
MTQPIDNTLISTDAEETETLETPVVTPPPVPKVSRFGPAAYQNGSKFGKGAMGFNPPNKQRPGRAAGRGR